MKYRNPMLSMAVAATLSCAALPVLAGEFRAVSHPVQGQYIVVLKDNAASLANERSQLSRVSVVARDVATKHRARLVRSFSRVLRGFVVKADDKALARLLADPRVAYVEEDGIVKASATQTGATWGIDRVDQRNLPLDQTYNYDTTASGVHAYVIDTGVMLNHSQFTGRMGNGFDAVTSGGNANDCNGHGTHVAGTIGGTTHGLAKGVTIHPVRVLDCSGSGTYAGVIAGMDWVAQNHVKPAVANMSLGGGASQSVDDAVARMTSAGVIVAVAAGNDNGDACTKSPARAPSAITVGSTTSTDARSSFSNYGTCLDIYAPGSNITSAWHISTTATNTISGTSMASPHVAGAAALYLASNPTATPAQVTAALVNAATPDKVSDARPGSPNKLLYSLGGGTSPVTYTVSGTITSSAGAALPGVTVSAGVVTATTNSSGAYTLTGLSNGTYTLTPSLNGYTFVPATRSVTVSGANITGQNFSGSVPSGGNALTKGVPVTGLAGAKDSSLNYTLVVPAGATNLKFTLSGGSGDADLYVNFGSAPTDLVYNCRPFLSGNAESCSFTAPQAGTYHVRVKGWTAFAGVSLVGDYSAANVVQTYTNAADYAIPDNGTIDSPITVSDRTGNGSATTPVSVDIKHTWIGELAVDLVAPDGTAYRLHNLEGGSADNINKTYSVDLSSEPLNGVWKLRVRDTVYIDTGRIDSWSITF